MGDDEEEGVEDPDEHEGGAHPDMRARAAAVIGGGRVAASSSPAERKNLAGEAGDRWQ